MSFTDLLLVVVRIFLAAVVYYWFLFLSVVADVDVDGDAGVVFLLVIAHNSPLRRHSFNLLSYGPHLPIYFLERYTSSGVKGAYRRREQK